MRCNKCGKKATKKCKDPFIEEILPKKANPEVWWCEECYQEALYEI